MKLSLEGMQNAKERPDFRRQTSRIRFIYGIGIKEGRKRAVDALKTLVG